MKIYSSQLATPSVTLLSTPDKSRYRTNVPISERFALLSERHLSGYRVYQDLRAAHSRLDDDEASSKSLGKSDSSLDSGGWS
jgi:hypothetical protein